MNKINDFLFKALPCAIITTIIWPLFITDIIYQWSHRSDNSRDELFDDEIL